MADDQVHDDDVDDEPGMDPALVAAIVLYAVAAVATFAGVALLAPAGLAVLAGAVYALAAALWFARAAVSRLAVPAGVDELEQRRPARRAA